MEINTALLSTAAECDNALDLLNAEKTLVERRLRNLGEMLEIRSATTLEAKSGFLKSIMAK